MASKVHRRWWISLLGLLALVVLVFPALECASASTASSFPDVPPSAQYADAVNALSQAQVVTGFDNGQFGPTTSVIRQQFAKMVVLALQIPVSEADTSSFADVPRGPANDLYPDNYIAACAAYDITDGTSPGKFSPERNISRAQAITMIVRAADNLRPGLLKTPPAGYASTWGSFDPVHGPTAAKAEFNGLLKKLPLTSLSPWGDMSRGEVAQVLANLVVENVKDFGAMGDGTVNDAGAIQEALSKAGTNGGGIVYVPAGTYKVLSELRVDSSSVQLVGDGANSLITAPSPTTPEVAISIGGTSTLHDVSVRDLSIVGNYAKWNQIGIMINGLTNGTFQDLSIQDVGFCGLYGFPASNVLVDNVTISHCGDFGIQFKEGSANVTVSNSTLSQFQSRQYPGHGIYFEDVQNGVAFGNHISDLPSGNGDEISGIKYSGASGHCYDNLIEDAFGGISTPGAHDVLIEGNTIRRAAQRGIYILAGANNITAKDNTVEDATRAIQLSAYETWPTNVHLIGNTVTGGGVTVDLSGGQRSMIVEETGNSWQLPATTTTTTAPPT